LSPGRINEKKRAEVERYNRDREVKKAEVDEAKAHLRKGADNHRDQFPAPKHPGNCFRCEKEELEEHAKKEVEYNAKNEAHKSANIEVEKVRAIADGLTWHDFQGN